MEDHCSKIKRLESQIDDFHEQRMSSLEVLKRVRAEADAGFARAEKLEGDISGVRIMCGVHLQRVKSLETCLKESEERVAELELTLKRHLDVVQELGVRIANGDSRQPVMMLDISDLSKRILFAMDNIDETLGGGTPTLTALLREERIQAFKNAQRIFQKDAKKIYPKSLANMAIYAAEKVFHMAEAERKGTGGE